MQDDAQSEGRAETSNGEAVQGDTPTGVSPTPLFKQRSYRIQLHRLPIRVSESENWSTEARVMMMI